MPQAAAWLFRVSATRMRKLAIDGKLPFVRVHGIHPQPTRAYPMDALAARWGEPDPDRLAHLVALSLPQITPEGATVWQLHTVRPTVVGEDDELKIIGVKSND